MRSMWDLRQEFTDAFIICNDGQTMLRAHKICLAAASPFLRNLLRVSNTLTFLKTSKSDMESILVSIYTGDPDADLKVGKLEKSYPSQIYKGDPDADPKVGKFEKLPSSQTAIKSVSIVQLPPEVLVNIFSFLPTTSLLQNIALVSKQFNNVTKLQSVHKDVHFSSFASNIGNFLKKATSMTKLELLKGGGCKRNKTRITAQQLVISIQSHDHLQALNFSNDFHASFLYFVPLSTSKWWANLTQFNMEFEAGRYKQLSVLPEFDSSLKELGSSGNLTHFGLGSQAPGSPSDSVFNFLLSPTLSKLRCLTLFDNYSWPMMESISAARKDSLEMLFVCNIHSSYKIPNLPNLKILETHGGITSLDDLPNLQKLQFLKIMDFARDCTVPSNSLPNLVQLNVGSCTRYFGPPGQVCYPNKVTYFYYNVKV